MVIYPRSIKLTDPARETIEQSVFMTTTDSGVLVTDGNTDGTAGKYTLGVTASEDTDSGKSTLTLISAVSLIDENITGSFANMSNLQIFMAALTQNINIVSSVTIPARSLSVTYNVFDSYGVYASLFVFILPAVCLATGLIVWLKRRKR
jgi:ABC-2 type transport system permease protein